MNDEDETFLPKSINKFCTYIIIYLICFLTILITVMGFRAIFYGEGFCG